MSPFGSTVFMLCEGLNQKKVYGESLMYVLLDLNRWLRDRKSTIQFIVSYFQLMRTPFCLAATRKRLHLSQD